MITVLVHEFVTGGGLAGSDMPPSWAAEGGAMRRALAEDFAAVPGVRVVMTLDARLPDEPGPWRIVRIGPGAEPEVFENLAAQVDSTLVIAPETDGVLLDRARMIETVGGRSLGSMPGAIAVAGHALSAVEALRESGLRTPPTTAVTPFSGWPRRMAFLKSELSKVCPSLEGVARSVLEGSTDEVEHPAVLKPVDGAGSIHTFVLSGVADWPDPSWRPEVAVLQPWIEGEAMSVSLLVGRDGHALRIGWSRQRVAVEGGRLHYRGGIVPVTPCSPEFDRIIEPTIRAIPGLRGWVGIDFVVVSRGRIIVLEVNPRPTTSIVGFRALLPAGTLADAWLKRVGRDGENTVDFREEIGTALVPDGKRPPVVFNPDGTILVESRGKRDAKGHRDAEGTDP